MNRKIDFKNTNTSEVKTEMERLLEEMSETESQYQAMLKEHSELYRKMKDVEREIHSYKMLMAKHQFEIDRCELFLRGANSVGSTEVDIPENKYGIACDWVNFRHSMNCQLDEMAKRRMYKDDPETDEEDEEE